MKLKYSNIGFTPKEINEENHSIRAIFSTADVDRHGEVVDQKSWLLDDFMKNPVVLFGHDHGQPPVGKVTGLGYNGDGDLEGEIQFAAKQYPFASILWNLYKDGFMKAFSVGFSSGNVDVVDEQVILKNNTLFEISTVSVPANAMALAKSKGLNVDSLEVMLAKQLEASLADTKEKECETCNKKGCACNEPNEEAATEEAPKEEADTVEAADTGDDKEQTGGEEAKTVEKGEVEDELGEMDDREKKWNNLDEVHEIFGAFMRVYMDSETSVGDFSKLLKETGELFIKKAGGGDDAKKAVAEYIKDNESTLLEILQKHMADETEEVVDTSKDEAETIEEEVTDTIPAPEVVMEETTATDDVVIDTSKSLADIITDIKEGRVLSKANRGKLEAALEAIQKILEADKPADDKSISDDITAISIKVETPAVRVSVPSKGPNKNKAINKAIRALLAEKSN